MKRRLPFIAPAVMLAAGMVLPPAAAEARIDIVTVPSRDRTELTIYNSQDLTLVREERDLTFTQGRNEIQFAWTDTLIDPTSLQLDLRGAPELTLMDAVYPAGTRDMIVWEVEAEEDTSRTVEILYFISGLSWEAGYTATANPDETHLDVQQFTTVTNRSGETFERAETRVVVGDVHLLEAIEELAKRGIEVDKDIHRRVAFTYEPTELRASPGDLWRVRNGVAREVREEAAEIIRAAVSELHILSIEGEEEIRDRYSKELPSPTISEIPFDLSYEYDRRRFGNHPVKFYKFRNISENNLGEDPLPDGRWYVRVDDGRGGLRFEGRTTHDYVPVGDEAELRLGSDGLLTVEESVTSVTRRNFSFDSEGRVEFWEEDHTMVLEVRNSRDRTVPLRLTQHLPAAWDFVEVSDPDYEILDYETVRWDLELDPMEKRRIEFIIRFERERGDPQIDLTRSLRQR